MTKIGLLSDTHSWLNPKIYEFFKDCDEIWHAGDIGSDDVAIELAAFKKLRAVYGNIDDWDIRADFPQFQIFKIEEIKVIMTHIGGYPNAYAPGIKQLLLNHSVPSPKKIQILILSKCICFIERYYSVHECIALSLVVIILFNCNQEFVGSIPFTFYLKVYW